MREGVPMKLQLQHSKLSQEVALLRSKLESRSASGNLDCGIESSTWSTVGGGGSVESSGVRAVQSDRRSQP